MRTIEYFFILIFISLSNICSFAQTTNLTYTDAYDLNFTFKNDSSILYTWRENGAYSNYTIPMSNKYLNRTLFTKAYLKGFPFSDRLKVEYEQRILLPEHEEQEGCVEFEYKGSNIKSIIMIFDGINYEEKIIFSDTLKFVPDSGEFSTVSKNILLTDIDMLNIRINAEGEISQNSYLTFSKLNILLGDKGIDEFLVRKLPIFSLKDNLNYIPINIENDRFVNELPEIENSRIIGLGESIHGNDSIGKLVNKIVFEAVKKQKCRLIILEMPFEKTLSLNRFIQSHDYIIDSMEVLKPEIRNLLNILRVYNSGKEDDEKVKLFGMGYNSIYSPTQNSAIDIFDFLVQINQSIKNPEIDKLSILLMEKDWTQSINYLQTHKDKIQGVLTKDEIDCILHILNLSNKIGVDGIKRNIDRDSVMFVNAKFLIDKYSFDKNLKTIIYGHFVHINSISTFPVVNTVPFGNYMKMAYNDDYSPFLLLIGQGSSVAFDSNYNMIHKCLEKNPNASIECFFSSLNEKSLYLPIDTAFNRLVLSRFKGSHHTIREFYPFNLYQRYKGVFFINEGYSEASENDTILFEESSKRFIIKVKQRNEVLEDIKKRITD